MLGWDPLSFATCGKLQSQPSWWLFCFQKMQAKQDYSYNAVDHVRSNFGNLWSTEHCGTSVTRKEKECSSRTSVNGGKSKEESSSNYICPRGGTSCSWHQYRWQRGWPQCQSSCSDDRCDTSVCIEYGRYDGSEGDPTTTDPTRIQTTTTTTVEQQWY